MMKAVKQLIQTGLKPFGYRFEKLRQPLPGNNFYIIDFALHILNQHRDGKVRFVQIGANDGIEQDPCYPWLQKYPWQGVLIEPQPNLARRLRKMYQGRKNIVIEEAVIADRSGQLDLYYLPEHPDVPSWASLMASLDLANMDVSCRPKIPRFDELVRKITVPAYTFNELLDRHQIETLDFLQIDTEGYDARILASIDFTRVKPAVISYEDPFWRHNERVDCRALLAREGYRFGTWDDVVVACLPEVLPIWDERLAQLALHKN